MAKCPKCGLKLHRDTMQRRRKTRLFRKYECPECGNV